MNIFCSICILPEICIDKMLKWTSLSLRFGWDPKTIRSYSKLDANSPTQDLQRESVENQFFTLSSPPTSSLQKALERLKKKIGESRFSEEAVVLCTESLPPSSTSSWGVYALCLTHTDVRNFAGNTQQYVILLPIWETWWLMSELHLGYIKGKGLAQASCGVEMSLWFGI